MEASKKCLNDSDKIEERATLQEYEKQNIYRESREDGLPLTDLEQNLFREVLNNEAVIDCVTSSREENIYVDVQDDNTLTDVLGGEIANVGPHDEIANVGPHDEIANVGPHDEIANVGPHDEIANVGPHDEIANVVPLDEIANVVPLDEIANVVPLDEIANVVPLDEIANVVPLDEIANVVPRDEIANVVPRDEIANVVPRDEIANAPHDEIAPLDDQFYIFHNGHLPNGDESYLAPDFQAHDLAPLLAPGSGSFKIEKFVTICTIFITLIVAFVFFCYEAVECNKTSSNCIGYEVRASIVGIVALFLFIVLCPTPRINALCFRR